MVVREALTLNPMTAEVEVDGANSDPIPHILKGIVLKVRDLRVYVDKPDFILNPTCCEPSSGQSNPLRRLPERLRPLRRRPRGARDPLPGGELRRASAFKPKLTLALKGGTRRGGHPACSPPTRHARADANIGKGRRHPLPQSAFLDQAHIRTICTRVQYAATEAGGIAQRQPSTATPRPTRRCSTNRSKARSTCAPPTTSCPTWSSTLHGIVNVDIVGQDRLRQRRHQGLD